MAVTPDGVPPETGELAALAGRYTGFAHRRTALLAGQVCIAAAGATLVVLGGGYASALIAAAGVVGGISAWLSGHEPWTTVITPTGLSSAPGGRRPVRTIAWQDVVEVHERPAWRRSATVRLRDGEGVALPGVADDVVRRLRAAVDALPMGCQPRRTTTTPPVVEDGEQVSRA